MFGVSENLNLKFWILQKDVQKYLHQFVSPNDKNIILLSSVRKITVGLLFDYFNIRKVIEKGYLKLLQWGSEKPTWVWILQYSIDAVVYGHLEILKWALKSNRKITNIHIIYYDLCSDAAEYGHLKILKWARANRAPWSFNTCALAARYGHLEVLQWARENGAPWNLCVTTWAAQNNSIETLKWALANGASWNRLVFNYAEKCNDQELISWAKENKNKIYM